MVSGRINASEILEFVMRAAFASKALVLWDVDRRAQFRLFVGSRKVNEQNGDLVLVIRMGARL